MRTFQGTRFRTKSTALLFCDVGQERVHTTPCGTTHVGLRRRHRRCVKRRSCV